MGRDGVLPKKFFGQLKPGSDTPTNNILLIGALAFLGAVLLNYIGSAYQHAGELLNFGAFLAFMGVNLACFWQFAVRRQEGYQRRGFFRTRYCPIIGFLFCGLIWFNLKLSPRRSAASGSQSEFFYVGYKTNWFRSAPVMIDFSDS